MEQLITEKVTVAICTWNGAERLRLTLDCFTRLQVPADVDWELLVINNNCTDHTDDVVRSFASKLPVRLLHEAKVGQSHARNLAIKEASGNWILWTDDDVFVEPDWMAQLLGRRDATGADWVFGRSRPAWPGAQPKWFSRRFYGNFAILDYGDHAFEVRDRLQPFFGLNFAGSRSAHEALGGFNTEFGFKGKVGGVGEDVDMFERALAAGMRIVYEPAAIVHHMIAPERVHRRYHRRRAWVANEVYFKALPSIYPDVAFFLGLPRFFFSKVLRDAGSWTGAMLRADWGEAFHHELHVARFCKLMFESAKNGFSPGRLP